MKDYDIWNTKKKQIETSEKIVFVHEREIWWCSLGLNIGSEIDGKHDNFERPVLILKRFNNQMVMVLPLTSKEKNDKYHFKIDLKERPIWVILSQVKIVSPKRLFRKFGVVSEKDYQEIKTAFKNLI